VFSERGDRYIVGKDNGNVVVVDKFPEQFKPAVCGEDA
jgi:hypothetical protein